MINEVFQTVEAALAKEQDGYVSPSEFNSFAKQVQEEIFQGYFEQLNRHEFRAARNAVNDDLADIPAQLREKIDVFASVATMTESSGNYIPPTDSYYTLPYGLIVASSGAVVELVDRAAFGYVSRMSQYTQSGAQTLYPTAIKEGGLFKVTPTGLGDINVRYIRQPLDPKWTYNTVSNNPIFNISDSTYQDFELHPSEFSNIVVRMLSLFGINLRESQVVELAESMKNTEYQKDNQQ